MTQAQHQELIATMQATADKWNAMADRLEQDMPVWARTPKPVVPVKPLSWKTGVFIWVVVLVAACVIFTITSPVKAEPFDPYRAAREQSQQIDQMNRYQHEQLNLDVQRRNERLRDEYQESARQNAQQRSYTDPNPFFGVQGPGGYRACQEGYGTVYCN